MDFEKEITSKIIECYSPVNNIEFQSLAIGLDFSAGKELSLKDLNENIDDTIINDDDCSTTVFSYGSWSDDDFEYEHGPTVKMVKDLKDVDDDEYGNLIYEHFHPTLDEKWLSLKENWEKPLKAFEIVQKLRLKYNYDVLIRKISQARNGIYVDRIKIPIGYKSSQVLDELWETDVFGDPISPYLFQIFIK